MENYWYLKVLLQIETQGYSQAQILLLLLTHQMFVTFHITSFTGISDIPQAIGLNKIRKQQQQKQF